MFLPVLFTTERLYNLLVEEFKRHSEELVVNQKLDNNRKKTKLVELEDDTAKILKDRLLNEKIRLKDTMEMKDDVFMEYLNKKSNENNINNFSQKYKSKKEYLKRLLIIRAHLRKLPKPAQKSRLHNALNIEIMKLLKNMRKIKK